MSHSARTATPIRQYLVVVLSLLGLAATAALLWNQDPALAFLPLLPALLVPFALRAPALTRLSQTDPETGLYNLRFFRAALTERLACLRPGRRPATVVLAGLDDLHDIQNSYGHRAGDALLGAVAAVMARTLPPATVVACYGGEALAILLPETRPETAQALIENARLAVEAETYPVPGSVGALSVTLSFGLAAPTGPDDTAETLLDNADTALCAARRAGHNQVRLYSAEPYAALFAPRLAA